jgi:hypothetical protein
MKKHNKPYLRFLGLVETLDRLLPGAKLDMIEEALLNQIMLSADFGKTILVGDLVSLERLGSHAMIHGRLKSLELKGYIELNLDKNDQRKKHVSPTKLAIKRFEAISKCIQKASVT